MVARLALIVPLVLRAALTLALLHVVAFALLGALPGDPLARLAGPEFEAGQVEAMRAALRLDRPWPERCTASLLALVRLDPGLSLVHHRPVAELLAESLPASLVLGSCGLMLAGALGLLLARLAWRRSPRGARALDEVLLAVSVVPRFWLGLLLVLLFHAWIPLLPASHAFPPGGGGLAARAVHLVLPALTIALPIAAVIARYVLAGARDPATALRLRQAETGGIARPAQFWSAVVRPLLPGVLALLAADLPLIVSGSLVVEVVFAWPGVGRLAADAIAAADQPLALAAIMLTAVTVLAGSGIAAAAATRLDPRSRGAR